MYYTVIKHSGHLRALEKCRIHSPAARVFYISLEFSNARSVLSQCNTRLRLLYLLNITYHRPGKNHLANQSKARKWLLEISARLKFVFRKHDFSASRFSSLSETAAEYIQHLDRYSFSQQLPQHVWSLFQGAKIQGGIFNISINSMSQQSLNLSLHSAKRRHYMRQ